MDFIEILNKFDTNLKDPFNKTDLILNLFSTSYLAERTGISYPTIAKMKKQGLNHVSSNQILTIAAFYDEICQALKNRVND